MEVSIRDAGTADVPAIRRVARESWHAAHDGIVGPEAVEQVVENWYDPGELRTSVAGEDGAYLVAEATGGPVVGFAHGVLGDESGDETGPSDDDPAWLSAIYVEPDRWGNGVGSDLLARVEDRLRERGARRLRLAVMADNEVANAFYDRHGYEVAGEREAELFGAAFREYRREAPL